MIPVLNEIALFLMLGMLVWLGFAFTSGMFLAFGVPVLTSFVSINITKLPLLPRRAICIIFFPVLFSPILTVMILDYILKAITEAWTKTLELISEAW